MNETRAQAVVARALMESYPTWTDEYGTNVEQLTDIVVSALAEHGLLVESAGVIESDPVVEPGRADLPVVGA